MIPTGQQIFDLTRSILGDTEIAGGQIFKNSYLLGVGTSTPTGPYASAYDWLMERMRTYNDRRTRRTQFGLVNPYIGLINPLTFGIANMGSPVDLWERNLSATYLITGYALQPAVTGTDPYVQLTIAHNGTLVNGQQIDTYLIAGLSDDINGTWTITVPDSSHIRLMGCTSTGIWTPATGMVLVGSEAWPSNPMTRQWDLNDQPQPTVTAQAAFGCYTWAYGTLNVPALTLQRELRIAYNISGNAPPDAATTTSIDDSLNVLAYRVAAIAGKSKGHAEADIFEAKSEQLLQEFLQPSIKDLQRDRFPSPRWRPKRNTGLSISY